MILLEGNEFCDVWEIIPSELTTVKSVDNTLAANNMQALSSEKICFNFDMHRTNGGCTTINGLTPASSQKKKLIALDSPVLLLFLTYDSVSIPLTCFLSRPCLFRGGYKLSLLILNNVNVFMIRDSFGPMSGAKERVL